MRITRLLVATGALAASSAACAVEIGYLEDFNSPTLHPSWGGGAEGQTVYEIIPTGGVGGADDGYLRITNPNNTNFGIRITGPVPSGDWIAEGVTGVSFWINDVGASQDFEFHFSVGTFTSLWQYDVGFIPGENEWTYCEVDFTNPDMWSRIRGNGTFEDALRNADRMLFRHDLAPYGIGPDNIAGDMGFDRVRILPAPGAAGLLLTAGLLGARRRR